MKTREELLSYFGAESATYIDDLLSIQEYGYAHGAAGWYPYADYSSDADWCYGVGAHIKRLEEAMCDDCGDVFQVYSDAHSAGMSHYDAQGVVES